MSRTTINFTPTLYKYYNAHAYREAPVLAELRAETARHGCRFGRQAAQPEQPDELFDHWSEPAGF